MFNQTLSLTNTRDIIANHISLIIGDDVVNILDLFEKKKNRWVNILYKNILII